MKMRVEETKKRKHHRHYNSSRLQHVLKIYENETFHSNINNSYH